MKTNKEEKKKYLYLGLGLFILMIMITGATYAYFALTASNNTTITGTVGGATLSLTVTKKFPTQNTNMIPQLESTLGDAISDTYSCVDDHNNVVCQVYQATVQNTGTSTAELEGVISFQNISNLPNLKWARIETERTMGTYTSYPATTSEALFETSKVLAPNESATYYFVIWIDEIGEVQADQGTFRATINFRTGGETEGITSTIRPHTLLSSVPQGSYVAYTGSGGTVGSTSVSCQTNGPASSSTSRAETEAPNSCLGQNAREDLDASENTHGYCFSSKYVTTGWRIAYIDQTDVSNPKAILVSAGSPECNNRVSSTANVTYIQTANAKALKYCNQDYVDGDCACPDSNADGLCDSPSTDAWAINDTDFYYMTKAISGYGKRLTEDSSSLGDSGGSLTTLYCDAQSSQPECGYNNDLIDNGGYYWFAARYSSSDTTGVVWGPYDRYVAGSDTSAFGLRPVISLSSSVYITGGSGTMEDPYQIGI